jgi:lysophospholipase L1-like esterase
VSDAVPLVAEAGSPLAVSLFLPVVPQVLTQHWAMQTAYLSGPGDATFGDAGAFGPPMALSVVLTGVEVYAPRPVNSVVAVGDSITDGMGAAPGESWPDVLGARLLDTGGETTMAVLGAGISGNRLIADGGPQHGDVPLARFDRDVAAAGGATDVVLSIGTNDIAAGRAAADVVAGLRAFAERARAAGKRVFLTTVTPSAAGPHGSPAAVAARQELNAWVRTHGPAYADGIFDFAAAVADPRTPTGSHPPSTRATGCTCPPRATVRWPPPSTPRFSAVARAWRATRPPGCSSRTADDVRRRTPARRSRMWSTAGGPGCNRSGGAPDDGWRRATQDGAAHGPRRGRGRGRGRHRGGRALRATSAA